MNYYAYEMAHAFMSPVQFGVQALRQTVGWPLNPMGYTTVGKNMIAACEVFENITRRYGKPEFGIKSVAIGGLDVAIREEIVVIEALLQSHSFRPRRGRRPASATTPRF